MAWADNSTFHKAMTAARKEDHDTLRDIVLEWAPSIDRHYIIFAAENTIHTRSPLEIVVMYDCAHILTFAWPRIFAMAMAVLAVKYESMSAARELLHRSKKWFIDMLAGATARDKASFLNVVLNEARKHGLHWYTHMQRRHSLDKFDAILPNALRVWHKHGARLDSQNVIFKVIKDYWRETVKVLVNECGIDIWEHLSKKIEYVVSRCQTACLEYVETMIDIFHAKCWRSDDIHAYFTWALFNNQQDIVERLRQSGHVKKVMEMASTLDFGALRFVAYKSVIERDINMLGFLMRRGPPALTESLLNDTSLAGRLDVIYDGMRAAGNKRRRLIEHVRESRGEGH